MNFTFTITKPKTSKVEREVYSGLFYAVSNKVNDEWIASIKTNGLNNLPKEITCHFDAKSHDITNRKQIFHQEIIHGRLQWVMYIRDVFEMSINAGIGTHTPFRENGIYSGKIFKVNNEYYFHIKDYVGHKTSNGISFFDQSYKYENITL